MDVVGQFLAIGAPLVSLSWLGSSSGSNPAEPIRPIWF